MSNLFDISSPQKRERFLLIIAGILFVIVMIPLFYYLFGSEVSKLRLQRNRFQTDIEKLEAEVRNKDQIKKRLADLTIRSLPPGDSLTQSLYQNWLLDTAYAVGLQNSRIDQGSISNVKAGANSPYKDHYKKYTFTIHCRGTLGQMAEFLRRFHKTDYLHLVRNVSPRPIRNSGEMEISITVEALALPQAKVSRTLRKISGEMLAETDDDRRKLDEITGRNLFAAYRPPGETPKPPETPKEEEFDQSPYCYVTAIVEVDDKAQVWVDLRTEGKKFKLFEGEMFRLGGVRCFVKKIEFDRVHFEAAGGQYTIKIGKSFAEYE